MSSQDLKIQVARAGYNLPRTLVVCGNQPLGWKVFFSSHIELPSGNSFTTFKFEAERDDGCRIQIEDRFDHMLNLCYELDESRIEMLYARIAESMNNLNHLDVC